MINFSKKNLLLMTIISTLALAGCASSNKLIVPDGAKRVPINRDATIQGTSTQKAD